MPTLKHHLKTIEVKDVDTNEHFFDLEIYDTTEQNVMGYRAVKSDEVLCTKYYMEHIGIPQVKVNIKKYLKQNNVKF